MTENSNGINILSKYIYFINSEVGVNLDKVLYFMFSHNRLYFYYDNKTITITDISDMDFFKNKVSI